MKTTLYLNSDKGDNNYIGGELGLSDSAMSNFRYALYEIAFDVEIDEETGHYTILEVRDGSQVLRPIKEK